MMAFVLQEQSTPLDEYVFSDDGICVAGAKHAAG
jgi:hypothetical protein